MAQIVNEYNEFKVGDKVSYLVNTYYTVEGRITQMIQGSEGATFIIKGCRSGKERCCQTDHFTFTKI